METLIQFDDYAVDPRYFVNNINKTFAALKAENERLKRENEVVGLLKSLKQELTPVIGFFNTPPEPPKKRLTKSQKLQLQIEDDLKRIEQQSMERIKKGNV